MVQSELPIRRVVVYRNGVAYFERTGHVENDEVHFKMKQAEVGDFLATLAVMEQGGSSVRSAAFPLDMDRNNEDAKPDAKHDEKAMRTVALSLDGRAHDLQIGYVAASPVWRPSYRVVVLPNGQAELQAWGIVQNLSGEDWTGVGLSLVAGAPLAFEAQLGTPVIPDRPIVTDEGEVIAAMPKSETSVEQEKDEDKSGEDQKKNVAKSPAPAPPPPPPADMPATGAAAAPAAPAPVAKSESAPGGGGGAAGYGDVTRRATPSGPRDIRSLAAVAVQGGSTRYDIPNPVTVPDKSATMVMLLDKPVKGESIFLYAPDGGVADSSAHPFHVVRFENATAGVLERGPIAVFEQGSFVGQGLLDPLPAGGTATVPFALERSIGIDSHTKTDVQGSRVAKIENGQLWIEHDSVMKTIYAIENGSALAAKVLVKHPRQNGTKLHDPPPGTDDNVGTGSALVPTEVQAHAKHELVVDERAAWKEYTDWFSPAADNAVKAFLANPKSDQDAVAKLTALWPLRAQIVSKIDERNKIQSELGQLASEANEKRADLRAIEKNTTKQAETLRKTLTARIAAIAARQETLTAQNIQIGQDLSEMQIRWREGVRAIHLEEVKPSGS
ncbi:MAG TPA: DUF4139 domain-containing protein [Polyangiaceae bacterium]